MTNKENWTTDIVEKGGILIRKFILRHQLIP